MSLGNRDTDGMESKSVRTHLISAQFQYSSGYAAPGEPQKGSW
jgi:hypothetical protein